MPGVEGACTVIVEVQRGSSSHSGLKDVRTWSLDSRPSTHVVDEAVTVTVAVVVPPGGTVRDDGDTDMTSARAGGAPATPAARRARRARSALRVVHLR